MTQLLQESTIRLHFEFARMPLRSFRYVANHIKNSYPAKIKQSNAVRARRDESRRKE